MQRVCSGCKECVGTGLVNANAIRRSLRYYRIRSRRGDWYD